MGRGSAGGRRSQLRRARQMRAEAATVETRAGRFVVLRQAMSGTRLRDVLSMVMPCPQVFGQFEICRGLLLRAVK